MTSPPSSSTETGLVLGPAVPSRLVPYLFVVIEGGRPLAGAARLRCDALDEIVIGRGELRAVAIDGRTATLSIPDRRLSSIHARIVRTAATWELVDAESKNGCRLDGVEVTRSTIRDGAWLALGQTVLRFRAADDEPPVWLDAVAPVAGIASVVPAFTAQLHKLAKLAPSRVALLVTGATGTGKELVARAIHGASGRGGSFVPVNCAALPEGLVESQLFGHRRGAFSGAIADHIGLVRSADGGTLLLDEVGDLPLPAQAALLRVLQEHEVVPVGDTTPIAVDVRVIAATHHDLGALVEAREFRADLFARLAGHLEALPPLAARREDLGTIVASALQRHARERAGDVRLTIEAAIRIVTAPWPHNARELDKAIEAALALAGGQPIDVDHLPKPVLEDDSDDALRARLVALLAEHRGNVTRIASAMGKARMQIQRWLKRFELDPEQYR